MIVFSRGGHGQCRNNRGGGPNPWKRGNKTLKFSIHLDANPDKFNQLLQIGFLNLSH